MVKFAGAAGAEAIEKATKKVGGGRWTPSIYWKDVGDTKFVQFIGDEQSFYTFQTFNMMTVGMRDNGKAHYESFISQCDPNVLGSEGSDLITERYGIKPKARTYAIALEVEPQVEQVKKNGKTLNTIVGFDPVLREYKDKDDVEHEVPMVGVVDQSPYIESFFPWLTDWAQDKDLAGQVFKITKKADGKDTRYYIEAAGDALDLDELGVADQVESLHFYIENLADGERQVEIISALSDDHILDKWAQKGQKAAPAKSSKPKSRAAVKQVDEGEEAASTDDVPETEGFAALRSRFAGSKG